MVFLSGHPVVSNSSRPHGLEHARPLCPSPSPEVCPSSYPMDCIGDGIQRSHPLTLSSPSGISLSQHQGLISNESAIHIRWPKYCSFSFSISPSSEYSGLISLKIDWFDLLAAQGTPRSIPQHDNSKAYINNNRFP